MNKLIILTLWVEVSDQYGTSKNMVVGVFDNQRSVDIAKSKKSDEFREKRHYFKCVETDLNAIVQ